MSGTVILTPPPVFSLPSRFTFAPQANTRTGGRSPFDGSEQTLRQPGERWVATLAWEGLTQDEWRPLLAFMAALGGRAGRFSWSPAAIVPRRATGGAPAPVVAGAGQVGSTLALAGFAGAAQVFRAGDLLGFVDGLGRPRLHMATADVSAAGGGTASVPIAPPLRSAPANGAAVNVTNPAVIWGLLSDRSPMDIARGLIAGGTLDIEEKLL
jgi:hypothetical protein